MGGRAGGRGFLGALRPGRGPRRSGAGRRDAKRRRKCAARRTEEGAARGSSGDVSPARRAQVRRRGRGICASPRVPLRGLPVGRYSSPRDRPGSPRPPPRASPLPKRPPRPPARRLPIVPRFRGRHPSLTRTESTRRDESPHPGRRLRHAAPAADAERAQGAAPRRGARQAATLLCVAGEPPMRRTESSRGHLFLARACHAHLPTLRPSCVGPPPRPPSRAGPRAPATPRSRSAALARPPAPPRAAPAPDIPGPRALGPRFEGASPLADASAPLSAPAAARGVREQAHGRAPGALRCF